MLVRRVSSMRCAKGLLHVRLVWTWLHRRSQCPMCCANGFELRSNRWVWVWIKYLRHSTIWMRPSTLLGDHLCPASKVDKICNIWVSRLDLSREPDNAQDASEIVDCTIGSSHCFQILLKIKMHHIYSYLYFWFHSSTLFTSLHCAFAFNGFPRPKLQTPVLAEPMQLDRILWREALMNLHVKPSLQRTCGYWSSFCPFLKV